RFVNDSLTLAYPQCTMPRLTWHETGYEPGYGVRPPEPAGPRRASTTMKTMKSWMIAIAIAAVSASAIAQKAPAPPTPEQFPTDTYEFILAKMAANEGRFDEALTRIDKVIAANPSNAILLFERAMIYVDASRMDRAEADLRKA